MSAPTQFGVTRGAQVTGVAVASLALSWITFTARLYCRYKIVKRAGWDDLYTIASMAMLTVLCVLPLEVVQHGLGAHIDKIPGPDLEVVSKLIFVCEVLYVATTAAVKAAIGAYFLRLAGKPYQRYIIWTTIAIVNLFSVMYFFFLLFQCRPLNYLWVQFVDSSAQGSCFPHGVLANVTYAHAAMSAVTDWTFGLLPIVFVYRLRMTMKTKLSVALVLSLGIFSSTATLVRIYYIKELENTTDYTWEGINLVKWSMVEPAIAITASNLTTLRPLFIKWFPSTSQPLLPARKRANFHSESSRPSTASSDGFTAEFADMLGLSRAGVTTTISANSVEEKGGMRRRLGLKRRISTDSQLELNKSSESGSTYLGGIRATTVIIIEGGGDDGPRRSDSSIV